MIAKGMREVEKDPASGDAGPMTTEPALSMFPQTTPRAEKVAKSWPRRLVMVLSVEALFQIGILTWLKVRKSRQEGGCFMSSRLLSSNTFRCSGSWIR